MRDALAMLAVLALLFPGLRSASAQETQQWTLRECIDHAVKHNLNMRQYVLNVASAHEDLVQSRASLLPSLNASGSHLYNFGRKVDPFTNEFSTEQVLTEQFSLSGDLTLFSGFQKWHAIRQSQYALQAGRYDADKMSNDISLAIAAAYLDILLADELRSAAENAALFSQQQVENTRRLVEAGSQPRGALLDMEAQRASDELQLVTARNQVELAYLNLVQLLDLDSPAVFRIVKPETLVPEEMPSPAAPEAIYNIALHAQPPVKSAELNVLAAQEGLYIARAQRYPRLIMSGSIGTGYSGARSRIADATLSGMDTIGYTTTLIPVWTPRYSYTYETTPFDDQFNDNLSQSFGFHLSIPLFNGWQARTNTRKAEIRLSINRLEVERQKQQLLKDIRRSHADVLAAMKKYAATAKALEARKVAFDYAKEKFEVGMSTSLQLNDAQSKLQKTQSDHIQAKYEYVFRNKILEFYLGKPIDL